MCHIATYSKASQINICELTQGQLLVYYAVSNNYNSIGTSMLKKIIFYLLCLIFAVVLLCLALFFTKDASRGELVEYTNQYSQFADLPMGANVHYRDEGDKNAPVIVLLHGGFGSLHNWEEWVPYLTKKYRVITMDLPGHGLTGRIKSDIYDRNTMMQLVRETLQMLDIERFTIGGNSMGGGIALAYTLKYPEQVNAVVLVSSEGVVNEDGYKEALKMFTDEGTQVGKKNTDLKLSLTEKLMTKFASPFVVKKVLKQIVGDPKIVTDAFAKRYANILVHEGNRQSIALMFKQYVNSMAGPRDLEPRLNEIRVPTLILGGDKDPLVTPDLSRKFDQLIPNTKFIEYKNVGHMAMIEVPKQSANDVLIFLNEHLK